MQHCKACTYEWKCTARWKCLLGYIKPIEVEVKMPKPIPVMTTRGVTMSQNVIPLKKVAKKKTYKKKNK